MRDGPRQAGQRGRTHQPRGPGSQSDKPGDDGAVETRMFKVEAHFVTTLIKSMAFRMVFLSPVRRKR